MDETRSGDCKLPDHVAKLDGQSREKCKLVETVVSSAGLVTDSNGAMSIIACLDGHYLAAVAVALACHDVALVSSAKRFLKSISTY